MKCPLNGAILAAVNPKILLTTASNIPATVLMSVAPPAVEIKVAPSRRMSVSIRNVFQVLAWSLWSPYSLVDYGYGLLHRSTAEGRLPTRARDWPQWWNDNPHHRAWLILAGSVALLLFACLLLILLLMITPLMITPLVALSARQIGAEVIVYVLLWAFTWGPTLLLVRWTATRTGNVGYLLMAALPGGIGIALLWMVDRKSVV